MNTHKAKMIRAAIKDASYKLPDPRYPLSPTYVKVFESECILQSVSHFLQIARIGEDYQQKLEEFGPSAKRKHDALARKQAKAFIILSNLED